MSLGSLLGKGIGATTVGATKLGANTVKGVTKTFIDKGIKKVSAEDIKNNPIKKLLPYEFTGAGLAMMGGAVLAKDAVVAANTAINDIGHFQNARKIGDLSVSTLSNQVGVTPSNYSAKFVRDLPSDIQKGPLEQLNPFYTPPSNHTKFYDDNAGGDLVLALHKLR